MLKKVVISNKENKRNNEENWMKKKSGVKSDKKGRENKNDEVCKILVFFFKEKTANRVRLSLVGSGICIKES